MDVEQPREKSAKIDVRQRHRQDGEEQEQATNDKVSRDMLVDAVRVFLVLGRVLRDIGRVIHNSEQIKERKHKNPDEIDKVPEQAGHLHAIGQMLGIALIDFFAYRQPHVDENQ